MLIRFILILTSFFIFNNINITPLKSDSKIENKAGSFNNFSRYLLGPGDILSVNIYKLPSLNSKITVLPDGYINLPRIDSIRIEGLNLEEAKNIIENKYKKILKNPLIYVDLLKARPISINIIGQVQRPGIYSISTNENNQISNTDGGESISIKNTGWPTLINGIQKAGGLKPNANIKDIKLRRVNRKTNKVYEKSINLWNLLQDGSLPINYRIFDGDTIFIKKVNNSSNEIKLISESNLAPSNITVTVIGEVNNPGKQNISSNSPVKLAILSSGGFTKNANTSIVNLLRLNEDKLEKKQINFIKKEYKSPKNLLRDGDVVFVDKNKLSKTTTNLKTLVEPVTPIINAASLYKILFGN